MKHYRAHTHRHIALADTTQAHIGYAPNCDTVLLVKKDAMPAAVEIPNYGYKTVPGMDKTFSLINDSIPLSPARTVQPANPAIARPYNQAADDCVSGIILACLLIMLYVVGNNRRYLKKQFKLFFLRPRTDDNQFKVETGSEHNMILFLAIQKCLIGGLLAFYFLCRGVDYWLHIPPLGLLGVYIGCFAAYFLVKRILWKFANWIFFDKVKKLNWKDSYSFISCAESLLFLPVSLVAVYDDPPVRFVAFASLFILLSLKFLLLIRTYRIFFGKLHCTLHLIVYFCTLELLPLTVLFAFLVYLTNTLIVK